VDLYLDSRAPVNAVQASLAFPAGALAIQSVDTGRSAFRVQARQDAQEGHLLLALGSLEPLSGRLPLATVTFESRATGVARVFFTQGSLALRAADSGDVLAAADGIDLSARPASRTFLSPMPKDGVNDAILFDVETTEVRIYDVNGRRVFSAASEAGSTIVWTGKDENGRGLPSGAYIAEILRADGAKDYRTIILAK